MIKSEDNLDADFEVLFNKNYALSKSIKPTNIKSLLQGFFKSEETLFNIISKTYKNQLQTIKKCKCYIYNKLNQEYKRFPKAREINESIAVLYAMVLSIEKPKEPSPQKMALFYKNEFYKSIENNLVKNCPKFLLREYKKKIKDEFCPFDKSTLDKSINPNINSLISIFNEIQKTKRLPIEINGCHFDLFILTNIDYLNKDKPFTFNYLMNNYKYFITLFNLQLQTKDDFYYKLCELLTYNKSSLPQVMSSLQASLINDKNIIIIICIFTLLFNCIVTIAPNHSISFVSKTFIIINRAKELLYNFIKGIAPQYVPEWYALVSYIQGPLIEPFIKPFDYKNHSVIPMSEIDLILRDSPVQYYYQLFIQSKGLTQSKISFMSTLFTADAKEKDISTIALTPLNNNVHSTTCNIMISGFMSEKDELEKNWKMMTNSIKPNEVCYFYNWPAQTATSITKSFVAKNIVSHLLPLLSYDGQIDSEKPEAQFLISKKTSKNAGKILAFILASRKVFTYKTINLIGFSLGVNVIKNCIKQLFLIHTQYRIPCDDIIQSTLMMAGASVIRPTRVLVYAEFYNTIVSGRIIHCYSLADQVLNIMFQYATRKQPIGNRRLELPLAKLENYDFSDINLGHMKYGENFDLVVKRIRFNEY